MRPAPALLAIAITTAARAGAPVGSMDDFVATELAHSGAPGIAYAVVENGETYSGARGEIRAGSGRPVTAETPFLLGSISKGFTAMAVMKLSEAGDLELGAPVSRYLKVFEDRPSGAITLRQLLSHTSGFSTRQGNDTRIDSSQNGDALQRQVARIARESPHHSADVHWQYSNANYQILGAVIEKVSGRSFASYLEAQILKPIGMNRSFVSDGRRHDAMAVGHQPWFGSKRPLGDNHANRVSAPAGGVVATASDMALYLALMLNGQDDVISAESKAILLRPASAASPSYGLGWFVDARHGTVYHPGLTPGVETLAVLSPSKRRGVVILVNANSGFGFGENETLLRGVSARALGLEDPGGGSNWGPKSLFLTFALLPVTFVIGIVGTWRHRAGLRAKSGASGAFSLWFPLVMTIALAWTALHLIPQLFSVPLTSFYLYQPDFVLMLVATAVTGLVWAVFRLGLFYSSSANRGSASEELRAP